MVGFRPPPPLRHRTRSLFENCKDVHLHAGGFPRHPRIGLSSSNEDRPVIFGLTAGGHARCSRSQTAYHLNRLQKIYRDADYVQLGVLLYKNPGVF
jgi:hypothetical protein